MSGRLVLVLLAVILAPSFAHAAERGPKAIRLRVGESKTLDVGDYKKLAIGQPDTVGVSASEQGGQLTVIGRSAGKSTLVVWPVNGPRESYLVEVEGDGKKVEAAWPARIEDSSELLVRAGEEKVLQLVGIKRITIGDPEIADVKLNGDSELLIQGNSDGRTSLLVWRQDGSRVEYIVRVEGSAAKSTKLATLPGVTVRVGEKHRFEFSNIARIGIANPEVADVELGPRMSLDVVGKAEGRTALRVWNKDETLVEYIITVTR